MSVKGLTYQRIEDYVTATGGSISGFLEEVIAANIGEPTEAQRREFDEALAREPNSGEDCRKFDEATAEEQVSTKTSRSKPVPIPVPPKATNTETPDELKDYVPPLLLL